MEREKIIEVAKKVFAKYGYRRTTLSDIADELGVTAPALYRYFPSKKELFKECIRSVANEVIGKILGEVERVSDPKEKLFVYFKAKIGTISELFYIYNVTLDVARELKTEVEAIRDEKLVDTEFDIIRSIVEEGMKKGIFREVDVDKACFVIYSVSNSTLLDRALSWSDDEMRKMVDVILKGLVKG